MKTSCRNYAGKVWKSAENKTTIQYMHQDRMTLGWKTWATLENMYFPLEYKKLVPLQNKWLLTDPN